VGIHDAYGKAVLGAAAGLAYRDSGPDVCVDYGSRAPARIDGTVGSIAIEIESRVSKQVRGAVLDLVCHPCPRKLLVLVPVHMPNPADTATQCRNILGRFINPADFRVVVLVGTGARYAVAEDVERVRKVLSELGWTEVSYGSESADGRSSRPAGWP
jgi:hypothetical protein